MRTIKLQEPKLEGDWNKVLLNNSHYDTILNGHESVEVLGPDGEQICVVLRGHLDNEMIAQSWNILKKVNLKTENRGSASGVEMERRVLKDGTLSNTLRVPKGFEVTSGVMGYFPRYPRIPFCRECSWNQHHQKEFQQLLPLYKKISELHKEFAPESFNIQQDWVNRTSKDFVIPETVYTTVTVNKNFRTASHLDAKNLYEGMAPMLFIRSGKFMGGDVVLPEWRTAVTLRTGDIIIFRNMKDYHGNTPIVPMSEKYQRCTLVFYYREDILRCGTSQQELERAKNGSTFSKDFSEERVCGECPEKDGCSPVKRKQCFDGGRP